MDTYYSNRYIITDDVPPLKEDNFFDLYVSLSVVHVVWSVSAL